MTTPDRRYGTPVGASAHGPGFSGAGGLAGRWYTAAVGMLTLVCAILVGGWAVAGCSSPAGTTRSTASIQGLDDFPVPAGEVTNLIAGMGGGTEWTFVIWTETVEQRDSAIGLLLDDGYTETGRVILADQTVIVALAKDTRNLTIALETEDGKPRLNYHLIQTAPLTTTAGAPQDQDGADGTTENPTDQSAPTGDQVSDSDTATDQTSAPTQGPAIPRDAPTKTIVAIVLIISVVGIGAIMLLFGIHRIRRGGQGDPDDDSDDDDDLDADDSDDD